MKSVMGPGSIELKKLYQRHIVEALIAAVLFHAALIGGVQGFLRYCSVVDEVPKITFGTKIDWLGFAVQTKPVIANISAARTNILAEGTPVPIPMTEFTPEATIGMPDRAVGNPADASGTNEGGGTVVTTGTPIDTESVPPDFNPGIEKNPEVVFNPAPDYPDVARRSGVEGTVFIKMWITKEGKVKLTEVIKSGSALFDQPAMDAAMRWVFTPAIMNNAPVSVWVTVPFKFRLHTMNKY